VCLRDSGDLVGVVNVSEIIRGALVIDDAFRRLRLHRLEANIQPANAASIRLVEGLGSGGRGSRRAI
jgi:ribosomal-protein-alanine N-acetyltransferase